MPSKTAHHMKHNITSKKLAAAAGKVRKACSLKRVVRAKLWHAKQRLNKRWIDECERLLNETGVPQFVCLVGESVPDNSVPTRLKWYLLRRKNVQRWETDNLDNEMKLAEQVVRDWMPFGSNDQAER